MKLLMDFEKRRKHWYTHAEVVCNIAFHLSTVHCFQDRDIFLQGELQSFCGWSVSHYFSGRWGFSQAAVTGWSTSAPWAANGLACTSHMELCRLHRGQECIFFPVAPESGSVLTVRQEPVFVNSGLVERMPIILHSPGKLSLYRRKFRGTDPKIALQNQYACSKGSCSNFLQIH